MEKGNGPNLEDAVGLKNINMILLSLDLEHMSKLHKIMSVRKQIVVSQTFTQLIDEELNRQEA